MPTLTIRDQTAGGKTTNELTMDILTERLSVRELIRGRVYQEVQDYNLRARTGTGEFRGLVRPGDAEEGLNAVPVKAGREIDWKRQFEKACEAFEKP